MITDTSEPATPRTDMKIVYFDGHCSLCNRLVDWLMRTDRNAAIKFASLQGQTAARHLDPAKRRDLDTMLYQRNGRVHDRSTAALMILTDLGGFWRVARIGLLLPKPIRDAAYRAIAKNRFRLFGRTDSCRMPTPAEKDRLLP